MKLLTDQPWKVRYDSDENSLIREFYEPALSCAVRYDRTTGYFSARVLTLVARGIEAFIRNGGRMRLLVGCILSSDDVEAIEKGYSIRDTVIARMLTNPLEPTDEKQADALELLSWMVAKGYLEVKVAVPCGHDRKPVPGQGIFHAKSGIVEDTDGNRMAFTGSINETPAGWLLEPSTYSTGGNWETFHVFREWTGDGEHVVAQEEEFARLWADRFERCLVIDVPQAVREDLLKFMPPDGGVPRRIGESKVRYTTLRQRTDGHPEPETPIPVEGPESEDLRRLVWGVIQNAPALPGGGERVGEATSAVTPWPHQVRAFQRMYDNWPPQLLIADEVGLGKTIEAGMILRQAWLSGRAKRILILAPRSVLSQWQIELREKFNLNWPIYDGQQLSWYPSRALGGRSVKQVARDQWHKEPFVLTSSQLMRRSDRAPELLESAEPYDLVVLDEAHHARRQGAGGPGDNRPNQLLRLMQRLREKTQGLILMTATPMQVHPIEVWDLLRLIGLPDEWSPERFIWFFEQSVMENPSHADFESMARLFRAVETELGKTTYEEARRFVPGESRLATRKLLDALRDGAQTERRQLDLDKRRAALKIMRANSPASRLISRNTRELLRRYFVAGRLQTNIAVREVQDRSVSMSQAERDGYEAVEDYISTTYNNASEKERNAIGFIMTVYRKRVASSFAALALTLGRRLASLKTPGSSISDDDVPEDDFADEVLDADEAGRLDQLALVAEERGSIEELLDQVKELPTDTKAEVLLEVLGELKADGYGQAMVFTQFTDTMDFLREYLANNSGSQVLCFSGRGGELRNLDGTWRIVSRDETKRIFSEGRAEVLLCTDAAAEGLNFQFCGAVVNYEMPWNPMRVEQRIGRIDRLGQEHTKIRVINLHYENTIETDVYMALRERINLFSNFVGKLQPILARLPRTIAENALAGREDQERRLQQMNSQLEQEVRDAEQASFDLDEITDRDLDDPVRNEPLYGLQDLGILLGASTLLPPGVEAKPMGAGEYEFSMPGMPEAMRVTTNAKYFESHPGSTELWSPGSPLFPQMDSAATVEEVAVTGGRLADALAKSTKRRATN